MKKIFYVLSLLFFFAIPLASKAYVIKSENFIYIGKDEVVEGNLYFSANSVDIEGKVLGDVIGIASNLKVNGEVSGDIIGIYQNSNINGKVDGNIRAISNFFNVGGYIGKNLNLLSESFVLEENGTVEQDILFSSLNTELNGKVGANIHGYSNTVIIRGEIGKNINLIMDKDKKRNYISKLQIDESAIIGGNIDYKSGTEAINKSQNIKGSINKQEPSGNIYKKVSAEKFFFSFLSLLFSALLINFLFRKKMEKLKNIIIKQHYKLSAWGFILLFLTPIICLLLMLTIIALPITLIVLVLWIISLFISKIISASALGNYIFKLINKEKINDNLKTSVGVLLICLLVSIPYIGWIFSLLSIVLGLGSIYYLIKNKNYVD
jgi:hypothetical protein